MPIEPRDSNLLTIGLAQVAPVWLNRAATIEKVNSYIEQAAREGCDLIAFGEALVPGYPFWLELTDGARFNSTLQKTIFAEYAAQAIQPEAGHLDQLRETAARHYIAVYLGCVERAADRGGHSLYCSLVYIGRGGEIGSVHRKLMPTYEDRLVWSSGDGNGLRTHRLGPFHAGGLNCWENWMPLPRTSLYAQARGSAYRRLARQHSQYPRHHAVHRAGIEVLCCISLRSDAQGGYRRTLNCICRLARSGGGGKP